MKFITTAALVVALGTGIGVTLPATAATTIRISSWAPPTHLINAVVWPTWGQWVEQATEGRVKTKIEYKLAAPPAQMDLIRDGVADVTWAFHGYNPGRFVATQAVELPGLGTSAEAASVAYWRVHQKFLAAANEHRGLRVLGLTSHGPGVIHTKQPISSLADLKGLKIRIGGGVSGEVGELLGVVGVRVPAPKVYETLSSGVADGIFMPMETKKSFRLKEVAPYSVIIPGGLYYGSFAFVMNPDTLAGLSAKDRAALLGVSGEKLSQLAGKAWDDADTAGLEDARAFGNTISTASDAMRDAYYQLIGGIEPGWVKRASGKGYDARAALDELRATARAYDKK